MAKKPPGPHCLPINGQRVLGCVPEIDYRTNVGTQAWKRNHVPRIRKLSALRRAHQLGPHAQVKAEMTAMGFQRAVDMRPKQLVKLVERMENG